MELFHFEKIYPPPPYEHRFRQGDSDKVLNITHKCYKNKGDRSSWIDEQ